MAKYKESRTMRYWLLVILMNVLFWLIVKHVAPEWYGSPGYYAGQIICTLIAAVITWRDPPDWLDGILLGVIESGVLIAGIIFFLSGHIVQAGILGAT
jgi:hypothetical protein